MTKGLFGPGNGESLGDLEWQSGRLSVNFHWINFRLNSCHRIDGAAGWH
jgi:hypothetical protein